MRLNLNRYGKGVFFALCILFLEVTPAFAADDLKLDGALLNAIWMLPFAGILLSLSLMPILIPTFWHAHYGKITTGWALAVLLPLLYMEGYQVVFHQVAETYLHEFIPFILMISTLYILSGSLHIEVFVKGTPRNNTLLLLGASLAASVVGTTGAGMLFIRPLLKMNAKRHHQTHTVIFFIFLVCNIGGSLSALGDPPLFLGFLNGIPFFWPTCYLLAPFLILWLPLLALYFLIDRLKMTQEKEEIRALFTHHSRKKIEMAGKEQLFLFACAISVILFSGFWKSNITFEVLGFPLKLENILRDLCLLGVMGVSFAWGNPENRRLNGFSWKPLEEVMTLFAGIFITAAPVMAILQAGRGGVLKNVIEWVSPGGVPRNDLYFGLSGALSAFLDNAPTYLAFFNLAGGDPHQLTGPLSQTLVAISCGAVFMGAVTYIGNAPNFMVKSIAEDKGVTMPHFLGYMGWSIVCLLPLFLLLTVVIFR